MHTKCGPTATTQPTAAYTPLYLFISSPYNPESVLSFLSYRVRLYLVLIPPLYCKIVHHPLIFLVFWCTQGIDTACVLFTAYWYTIVIIFNYLRLYKVYTQGIHTLCVCLNWLVHILRYTLLFPKYASSLLLHNCFTYGIHLLFPRYTSDLQDGRYNLSRLATRLFHPGIQGITTLYIA